VVHGRARREFGRQAVEGRRGLPAARGVPGIVGQVPQRQDPPPGRIREPGRAVHGQEVEEDGVARLQPEPPDVERGRVTGNVGQLGQAARRKPASLLPQERPGHQPRAPVRAGHQLQAPALGHRVHRDPGADPVPVDVVVRLILVPRRALGGPALLDQHVIVVEADPRGGHQRRGHGGHPRMPGQLLDLRDLPPPAEVLHERAGVIGAAGHLGQRSGRGQDRVDRGGRDRHLARVQHLADARHTVLRESPRRVFYGHSVVRTHNEFRRAVTRCTAALNVAGFSCPPSSALASAEVTSWPSATSWAAHNSRSMPAWAASRARCP
jgi:hypothetical protein